MRAEVVDRRGRSWCNLLETALRLVRDGEKTKRSRRWTFCVCSGTLLAPAGWGGRRNLELGVWRQDLTVQQSRTQTSRREFIITE